MLARHFGEHLRAKSRARAGRGEAPLPFEDTVATAMELKARDATRKTNWPKIDLIGAQRDLFWAEIQVPVWRIAARSWTHSAALPERLKAGGRLGLQPRIRTLVTGPHSSSNFGQPR